MDGLGFTFERIKIPSGGGLAFELPGEDDDEPDLVKEIEGVIVFHHPVNAYWAEAYTGQNNPPDCASTDGRYGKGEPRRNLSNLPEQINSVATVRTEAVQEYEKDIYSPGGRNVPPVAYSAAHQFREF